MSSFMALRSVPVSLNGLWPCGSWDAFRMRSCKVTQCSTATASTLVAKDLFVYNGALGALGACEVAWSHALQLFASLQPPRRQRRDAVALSAAIAAMERCSQWQSILALLFEEASPANLISYNHAISGLGRSGHWQIALELVMALEKRRFKLDAISYNSLISGFSTAHLWKEALHVLERFEEVSLQRDHFSYSATMGACGQAHFWQQACQLLAVAATVDHVMVKAALEACAQAVQWQQALHLWQHGSVATGRPLVMALGKGTQWLLALQVLQEMAPVVAEYQLVAAWNTVIGSLSSVSLSRALELLRTMEESQLRTDSRMYEELIDAAGKKQQWELCSFLLQRMRSLQGEVDLLSHCSVVTACHQSQQWQLAGWMLSALPHQQLEPDLAARNMFIDVSETGGHWQEAVESYQEAEETWGVDIVGLTSAMSALTMARRWRQSAFLFQGLHQRSLEATGMSYTVALRTYVGARKLRHSLQLLADLATQRAATAAKIAGNAAVQTCQLDSPWFRALSFYDAVRCLLGEREGNDASDVSLLSSFDRASQWQRSMDLSNMRRGTFPTSSVSVMKVNTVINACSMALEWRRGVSLLFQLPLHGLQGSCVSFHSAFAGSAWRMVLGLLEQLGGELSLDTYHAALQALRRDEIFTVGPSSSSWQAAVQLFGVAKAQLRVSLITLNLLISSVPWNWALYLFSSMQHPDSYSYYAVMNTYLRADQWQRCLEVCRSMRLEALNPDQRIYSPLLERCLGGAFPLGEVLKALEPWKSHAASAMEPLFPHVSYRHASLMVNFGKPMTKLPFTCRSVSEAATAHASVTPAPSGKYEMLMPVAFPDEGTFDWLDSFLEANPKYTELSDRKMMEWAVASGLTRPKLGLNASNDKPNYQYGVHSLDDNSLMKVVQSIPSIQPRNFVVMEVKSNLVAEERSQILKRFPGYKKVAHVVMGKPKEAYKHRVHNQILKQKQQKSDSTWRMKKAQQEQKKRILEQQKLMAEKKKEMEEKKKAEAEAKKAEEAKKAKEAKEAKEGEEGEEAAAEATEEPAAEETEAKDAEMKEEEPKAEEPKAEEEDLGDEPPQ
ncbi:unnamed protein product, partial [Cladocopium goreaui]